MTRRIKIYWSLKSFLACISFVYVCKYDPWNSKFFLTEQCHFCRIYWAYFLIIYNGFVLKQLVFSFGHLIFQQLAHQRKMDTFTIAQNPSKAGYMMNVSFFVKQSRWLLHISLCHRVIWKTSSFKFLGRSSITFQTETIPKSIQNWVKRWAGNRSR